MAQGTRDAKSFSPEARRKLRGILLPILQGPGLRRRIRWAVAWNAFFFLLALVLFAFFVRLTITFQFSVLHKESRIFNAMIRDEWSLEILLALGNAASNIDRRPDWPAAHGHLDRAEALSATPYGAYLRASFFAKERGGDRAEAAQQFREALEAGARLDPENLFWPILRAEAMAAGGEAGAGLRRLLQEAPGKTRFSLPAPEGPYRDLIALAEFSSLLDLPYFLVMHLQALTVQAVLESRDGEAARAGEHGAFLDRLARMLLEDLDRPLDRSFRPIWILREAHLQKALLAGSVPGSFPEGERKAAIFRYALAQELCASFGSKDDFLASIIFLVILWVALGFSIIPIALSLIHEIAWVLRIGRTTALSCLKLVLELRALPWTISAGALLGFWLSLQARAGLERFQVPPALTAALVAAVLVFIILGVARLGGMLRLGRRAGRGAWTLRTRHVPLCVQEQLTLGSFHLTAAAVALASLLLLQRHPVRDPRALLLSPERQLIAAVFPMDDALYRKVSALLSEELKGKRLDEIRAEAVRQGLARDPALPEGRQEKFRQALEEARGDPGEAGRPR